MENNTTDLIEELESLITLYKTSHAKHFLDMMSWDEINEKMPEWIEGELPETLNLLKQLKNEVEK